VQRLAGQAIGHDLPGSQQQAKHKKRGHDRQSQPECPWQATAVARRVLRPKGGRLCQKGLSTRRQQVRWLGRRLG
jgi:hypothetical protein